MGTYDSKHRAKFLTPLQFSEPATVQKGIRERLLCDNCERRISKHETYVARLLTQADELFTPNVLGITIPKPNLVSLRLFALSVLWRAHESTESMFADVDLGPLAEPIRIRVFNDDPGDPAEFGFAIAKVGGLGMHGDLIEAPMRARYKGLRMYQFLARGYIWCFAASKASKTLKESMPFVGTVPDLPIPLVDLNRDELFANIRKAFPHYFRK